MKIDYNIYDELELSVGLRKQEKYAEVVRGLLL
jgi:hypothetical protein